MFPSKLLKKSKSSSTDGLDKSSVDEKNTQKSFRIGLGSFMHRKITPQPKEGSKLVVVTVNENKGNT